MRYSTLAFVCMAPLATSCAPPIESVSTRLDEASSVKIINAPNGAELRINGRSAIVEDNVGVLNVADGWHDLTVWQDGRSILNQRVFVQDGTQRVIDLSVSN